MSTNDTENMMDQLLSDFEQLSMADSIKQVVKAVQSAMDAECLKLSQKVPDMLLLHLAYKAFLCAVISEMSEIEGKRASFSFDVLFKGIEKELWPNSLGDPATETLWPIIKKYLVEPSKGFLKKSLTDGKYVASLSSALEDIRKHGV